VAATTRMNSVSAVSATFNPRPSLRILGGAVSVLTEPFSLLRKEEGGFSLFHCRGCRVSLTAYLFCFAVAVPSRLNLLRYYPVPIGRASPNRPADFQKFAFSCRCHSREFRTTTGQATHDHPGTFIFPPPNTRLLVDQAGRVRLPCAERQWLPFSSLFEPRIVHLGHEHRTPRRSPV